MYHFRINILDEPKSIASFVRCSLQKALWRNRELYLHADTNSGACQYQDLSI